MQKLLIHYGELSLKGGNRREFERQLARNLKQLLKTKSVTRQYGRMLLEVESADEAMLARLALMPGIRNFAPVRICKPEYDAIRTLAEEAVLAATSNAPEGTSFKVETKRSNKRFPLTSPEMNSKLGGDLAEKFNLKVKLDQPELTIFVEISADEAFIYSDKRSGIGGLPVGSAGQGVVLLSGGIDSPVAAFSMMKRGMECTLVHCYNSTINRDFAKIRDLAKQLSLFQPHVRLLLVDLEEFQRHAIAIVPARYRMIIYKRQMIRVAARAAAEFEGQALVTGDSLGQVASQTLSNINAIYDASPLPLLAPLIASDKEEIIALGRRIGTYDISIEEYCDICSYLIAKSPETSGKRSEVAKLEVQLPIDTLKSPARMEIFFAGQPKQLKSPVELNF